MKTWRSWSHGLSNTSSLLRSNELVFFACVPLLFGSICILFLFLFLGVSTLFFFSLLFSTLQSR
jgi:hypothetical protein